MSWIKVASAVIAELIINIIDILKDKGKGGD